MQIINEIRQSKAFWNDCFEQSFRCSTEFPADKLQKLATNWYMVTRHFARTLSNLIVVIIKQHELAHDLQELERLEIFAREVTKIFGNDWGLGVKKFDDTNDHKLIHFKLFERIPQKLGFVENLEKETSYLMQDMLSGFTTSIESGFGKLLVVEYSASNILSLSHTFERAVNKKNENFFTKHDLLYFPLHEDIEKCHASDTEKLIKLIGNTPARQEEISLSVKNSTKAFGDFWDKMAELTFG